MADQHLLEATSGASVISSLSHLIRTAIWVAATTEHTANPSPNELSRIGLYMAPISAGSVKIKIRAKTKLIPLTEVQFDVAFEIDRKTITDAAHCIRGALLALLTSQKASNSAPRVEPSLPIPKDWDERKQSMIMHAEGAYGGIAAPLGTGAKRLYLSVSSPTLSTPIVIVDLDEKQKEDLLTEIEEDKDVQFVGVVRRFNIGSRKGILDIEEGYILRGERYNRKLRFEVKCAGAHKREDNRRISNLISRNLSDNSGFVSESGVVQNPKPISLTGRRILSRGGTLKRIRIVDVNPFH